ncbi:hypothetical protein MCU_01429 [Bartonella elizabethae Re6043vi]|uniref:Uncharacterized protein n=2 Tax=Bartonella elizabethae TaxID=807 RepID=J1K844_BAREL|nr:hypothetical protein [Bartonella elizabethae]EJF82506.1 hypothetical protein MCU_01429 [Bartonella elizabethae Re6043vi]EJF93490.1 hypothetical protein MEE_01468 [Bartonella elizabethae F9251 = ATCC 49927]VEJ41869.1 Uncharacterised protein [Bartonella elizabethae]
MKEKNWTLEKQTHKSVRSFACQQALLSPRDYKVIFALAVIIILWSMILEIPNILNWQLTGWQYAVHFVAFRVTDAIEGCALFLIPVMLLIRRNVTRALQKNIQKLEEAFSVREQINSLSHRL